MNDRIDYLAQRLIEHHTEIGSEPVVLSKLGWVNSTYPDPSNLHKAYGWVPPFEREDGTVVAPFCPSLIVEQSSFLDDASFESYCDTIEWSMSLHVTHRALAWYDREALIDKTLLELAEDSMQLQNRVQMQILDGISG